MKDFPADRLPAGLEAFPPATFASNTATLDPAGGLRAIEMIASRSGRQGPNLTVDDVLDVLDVLVHRYGLHEAVAVLRNS